MIDVDDVLAWLKAGGEYEAVEILSHCALEAIYFDTGFQGEREYDLIDVQIGAPRYVIDQIRNGNFVPARQIETAINEVVRSRNIIIHRVDWVAEPSFGSSQISAPEQNRCPQHSLRSTRITSSELGKKRWLVWSRIQTGPLRQPKL